MNTIAPFSPLDLLGPHITPVRVECPGGLVQLVLLVAEVGLVGALWCVRGRWIDATIGRA